MKRFYKNSLIIAVVSICVGVCMTLAGLIGGGAGILENVLKGIEFYEKIENKEPVSYIYPMGEYAIDNLELNIDASDLVIKYENTKNITITVENEEKHQCKIDGDTLKFEAIGHSEAIIKNWRAKITMVFPENYKFNDVKITLGAGRMTAGYLKSKELFVEVGAGSVEVNTLTVDGDALLTVGAGNMEVESLNAKNADLKVEAGNMEVNGIETENADIVCEAGRFEGENAKLSSEAKVECGAGSVSLDMLHQKKDFNYDLECSVGSIAVGEEKCSGLDRERRIENNADKEFDIECSVGAVEIDFEG